MAIRSEIKTHTKTAFQATEQGDEGAEEAVKRAVSRIDKAAAKGVLHKNTAARKKSHLMRHASQNS